MSESTKVGTRRSLINTSKQTNSKQGSTTPTEARRNNNQLAELTAAVLWTPTPGQRKAKARIMVALEENPVLSIDSLTCAQATELGKYSFGNVWNEPGFRQWLTGSREFKERVEYLTHLALDKAEDLLMNDSEKLAGAQVSLIGKVAELANKMPSRNNTDNDPTEQFSKMSKEQLMSWLAEQAKQLPPTVDVSPVEDESGE